MAIKLNVWNFPPASNAFTQKQGEDFVLKTCQRTLVVSLVPKPMPAHLQDQEAYTFLLETICGLKSKLIGENEIVGQFKEAYKNFSSQDIKDTRLMLVLEKLFQDAKVLRTKHLLGLTQKTYASLTRKHFSQDVKADHIVIIGSGQLAEDLINQFKKKSLVSICARNREKVDALSKIHQLGIIPWEKRFDLVNYPFIANTVGVDDILFSEGFFSDWMKHPEKLFIDLGSPSSIQTKLTKDQGVIRLENILDEGAVVLSQQEKQIEDARQEITHTALKRMDLFSKKISPQPGVLSPQRAQDVRYL